MSTVDPALTARPPRRTTAVRRRPVQPLILRAFLDARVRTLAFAYVFAIYGFVQPFGYRHAYPKLGDRLAFAQTFANNTGLRLLYGDPHDVQTVSGYTSWRVGGTLAIAAAIFGLFAAVRAFRTEEDAGRAELVLAAVVGRRTLYLSALAAIGAGVLLLWGAELVGLPATGSAYLALATASVAAVCVGVGAVASQLASTRRIALALGGALIALLFLLRVVADTTSGAGWLRWATPLGWAEESRPFTGAQPLVLLLPAATAAILLVVAARMSGQRDIGTGILPARDSADPRARLLFSPTAQALRGEQGTLIAWASCVAAFAYILGVVSNSVSSADVSANIQKQIAKLGSGSITTSSGYLSFIFLFFTLAITVFACTQIGAARQEEANQQRSEE